MRKGGCPRQELGWDSDAAWQVACLLCKQDGWEVSHTRETRAGINLSLNRALGACVLSLAGGELPQVDSQEHPRSRSALLEQGRCAWRQKEPFQPHRAPTLFPENP